MHGVFRESRPGTGHARRCAKALERRKPAETSQSTGWSWTSARVGSSVKDGHCGARTRAGNPCLSQSVKGRNRCRMHGGTSTGPRTPEGRKRLGELALARYIASVLADGWAFASPILVEAVVALRRRHGTHSGTAKALGVSGHALRRVLAGLPLRPEELWQIERRSHE